VQTPSGVKAWRIWGPGYLPPPPTCLSTSVSCTYADDCCSNACTNGLCVCEPSSKICTCIDVTKTMTNTVCEQNECCNNGICKAIDTSGIPYCRFPPGTSTAGYCPSTGALNVCLSGYCNYLLQVCQ